MGGNAQNEPNTGKKRNKTHLIIGVVAIAIVCFVLLFILLEISRVSYKVGGQYPMDTCTTIGRSFCNGTGSLPLEWGTDTVDVEGNQKSCQDILGCVDCISCGFSDPPKPGCIETWRCSDWFPETCRTGILKRVCIDFSDCGSTQAKPPEIATC